MNPHLKLPTQYGFGNSNEAIIQPTYRKNTEIDPTVLAKGKVFKNYRDLCKQMNWRVCRAGSNGYLSQFKTLSSVCLWRKDVDKNGKKLSNRLIIESVYEVKQTKPDKRKTSEKTYLTRLVSRRILDIIDENHRLKKTDTSDFHDCLCLTMGSLYAQIGLVNERYDEGMKNQSSLSRELGCPEEHVNDFYNCVSANLKKTVDSALSRLHQQRLVYSVYTKRLILRSETQCSTEASSDGLTVSGEVLLNNVDEINATERQRKFVFDCEHQVLRQNGLYSLPDVYTRNNHFRRHFFEQVVKTVNEQAELFDPSDYEIYMLRRLGSYYNILELSFTESYINREIHRLGEMTPEEREVLREFVDVEALDECLAPIDSNTHQKINQEHLTRITQNAKQRHQKALRQPNSRDQYFQRGLDTYSENMEKLAEKVIEKK